MPNKHSRTTQENLPLNALIDGLNRHYCHVIDDGDFERWPGFFVKDGTYRITTRWNHSNGMQAGLMFCENRAMMEDRVSALRIANVYEPHTYRHLVDPPLVINRSEGEASVQTSFVVYRIMETGSPEVFCTGKYLDKLVEMDKDFLFKERLVVCDSERIDTMIIIPL